MKNITLYMNKWRKKFHNKFKNNEVFWEMFFKELEDILEKKKNNDINISILDNFFKNL